MRLAPLCAPDVLPNTAMYCRGGFDAVMVSEFARLNRCGWRLPTVTPGYDSCCVQITKVPLQ